VAARIKQDLSVEPELIEGANGIFDVHKDGELVYSKQETGRFPEPEEVVELLG
jgi:selT/selW/selH-like putative selenoprotein